MTTLTKRSALDTTSFDGRGALGSTSFSGRGALGSTSFSGRSALGTTGFSGRSALTPIYAIPAGETETDQTAPVLSNFHANAVGQTDAEFDWDTDEPATCWIQYTTDLLPGGSDPIVSHAHLVMSNRKITAVDLTRGTTYHIRAKSVDAYGNLGATPDIYAFTTAETDTPGSGPVPV